MTTPIFASAAQPLPPVIQRLHRYPGCTTFTLRWFIVGDHTPMPYRTEAEALAELQRRQTERRRM